MNRATVTSSQELHTSVEASGFAFVEGPAMRDLLLPFGSLDDWAAFAASWERLELDTHMADGGRYRRRRHATFSATGAIIKREAHQPHFQTVDYNPLNGGVARWFEPIEDEIASGPTMSAVLGFCGSLFNDLAPATRKWHIEVHQFRIEARKDAAGLPTPEGLHRDGVDYVLVLLVDRKNIASGVTGIHALDGSPLGQFTLTEPLDSALVNDHRVAHGVTAVEPLDPALPAQRDVLVVTFRNRKESGMRGWLPEG